MRRPWILAASVGLAGVLHLADASAGPAKPAAAAPAAAPPAASAPPAGAPTATPGAPGAAAAGATPGTASSSGAPGAAAAAAPEAPPPAEVVLVAPPDTDQRMDRGLERLKAKNYKEAANFLYGVYEKLPPSDSRRDLAGYNLAKALVEVGLTQAAVAHYSEILSGRRTPELMDKTLAAIKALYEKRLVNESRFIEGVLYGGQYTDLTPEVADFVEYLQALTDIRHGFAVWGRARLETLAKTTRPYSFSARYALAVERIAAKDDDVAAKALQEIIASPEDVPFELKNQARTALGRILYEKKRYEDAWNIYSQVDSPLPLQDIVMVERAWDRVAHGEQQRALGLLVGLGAPVFRDIFAPERFLIRGIALRRLCQYRAAHLAVREFRAAYSGVLDTIKSRSALTREPTIRAWALAGTKFLRDQTRINDVLTRERETLGSVGDKPLRTHLTTIYASDTATVKGAIDRELEHASEKVAEELLRIDEQMSLVDYEIGAGLFKASGEGSVAPSQIYTDVPYGSDEVYFKFDGEYWSDELGDYNVLAADRCVR
jgi:tetratricopeptide (TPR) repeat protein